MKKVFAILLAALMTASLAGCAGKQPPDEDICPGKLLGDEGTPPVMAEGFDATVDMSFTTVDTNADPVTNEVFAGTERGVWLVFWQTDNEKSATELARLNDMLPVAEENGYKIVGVVMDGEKNAAMAKEMTADLSFDNIIWNDEVATRYPGVADFFTESFYKENQEDLEKMEPKPNLGDPISTRANSRGQIQTSCALVPVSNEKMERLMQDNDSNITYEESLERDKELLSK